MGINNEHIQNLIEIARDETLNNSDKFYVVADRALEVISYLQVCI
jgi:hypothetical protein